MLKSVFYNKNQAVFVTVLPNVWNHFLPLTHSYSVQDRNRTDCGILIYEIEESSSSEFTVAGAEQGL